MKVITLEVTVIFITSPFYIDMQDYSIFLVNDILHNESVLKMLYLCL